jgi:hypothetical protein
MRRCHSHSHTRAQSYELIAEVWKTNNSLRPNKSGEVLVSSNRAYFVRDFVKLKEGFMYAHEVSLARVLLRTDFASLVVCLAPFSRLL